MRSAPSILRARKPFSFASSRTGRRLRGEHAAELVQHPVLGRIETLKMLFEAAHVVLRRREADVAARERDDTREDFEVAPRSPPPPGFRSSFQSYCVWANSIRFYQTTPFSLSFLAFTTYASKKTNRRGSSDASSTLRRFVFRVYYNTRHGSKRARRGVSREEIRKIRRVDAARRAFVENGINRIGVEARSEERDGASDAGQTDTTWNHHRV
jgi:hypothetical protein